MRIEAAMLLCAIPLAAQTARVEGVVTNSATGAPVPRAHMTLEGQIDGRPGRYGTTSAADGRFSITSIAPGSYTLAGERVGFVRFQGTQRQDRITLKAGDSKTDIEMKLAPTGSIAGRVTDSEGEPVEGAFVAVEGSGGGAGDDSTDENGQFRIGGLAPGKYRVKASHGDITGGRPEIRTDGTAEVHNAATYYPGVLGKKEAGKVQVRAGAESTAADIQLVRVPFVRVSGKVVGQPPGIEEEGIMVWQGAAGTGTEIRPDGSFELGRLDPGKYTLRAEWSAANGERQQTAGTEVEVAGSNIDKIELRAVADSNISGSLEFEDDQVKEMVGKELEGPRVQLEALGVEEMGSNDVRAVGGSFLLAKVPAGKYRVNLVDGSNLYVKSMRLGSTLIDGAILDLSNGSGGADLSLMLSANTGSITGAVKDDSGNLVGGAFVTLTGGEGGFGHQTVSKADGTYEFAKLTPGSYKIAATEDNGMALLNNDDADDAMEIVDIGAGEKVTKDLKRQAPDVQ